MAGGYPLVQGIAPETDAWQDDLHLPKGAWAMTTSSRYSLIYLALLTAALAGCDSDDPSPPGGSPSVVVTPSIGKVLNAGIEARCLPTGMVMGSGSTGTTGNVTVALTGSCTGPVIVELVPNGASTYFDEAVNSFVTLPVGSTLRAIVPTLPSAALNVAITPLTESATRQALNAAGNVETAVTSAQATAANSNVVAQLLGAGTSLDILAPAAVWDNTRAAGSLGTNEADRHAFYLAALARMGGTTGTPALTVMNAIAADLADGTLSGGTNGGFTYTSGDFQTQLDGALNAMASYANNSLLTALGIESGGGTFAITSFSPASGTIGSTVTIAGSGFDADTTHMRVFFTNNIAAEVVSATATELVVTVPNGASNGPIRVENSITSTSQTSSNDFSVTTSSGGITVSNATPVSANGTLDTSVVNTVKVSDSLNRITVNPSGSHYLRINYNPSSGAVSNTIFNWVSEAQVASCAGAPCGVTVSLANSTVTFNNTVLTGGTGGVNTVTLNGEVGFTPPAVTWQVRAAASAYVQNTLAYGNSTFISAGNGKTIMTSPDGLSWTPVTAISNSYFAANSAIHDGSQFVLVGDTTNSASIAPMIATSPDGTSWTVRSWTHGNETQLTDVAYAASRLTAVGLNGTIITSTDAGVTWTNESSGVAALADARLNGVASNASTRVAVGFNSGQSSGQIFVNTGSGWVAASTNISQFCPKDVVWAGSRFVAVGGAGCGLGNAVVMTSPDGVTWTRVDIDTGIAPANHGLQEAGWDGSRIYATGDNMQTGRVIISSADGSTWLQEHTSTASSGQGSLLGIAFSPTRIVTVGGVNNVTKP